MRTGGPFILGTSVLGGGDILGGVPLAPLTMRTTVANTVERIRRQLSSSLRYEVNILGASMVAADTTISLGFDLVPGVRPGAALSVGTELMRVVSVDRALKQATVIRGWEDSEPADHANGLEVWVNPRFSGTDIYEAMYDELNAWAPDLYRVVDLTTLIGLGVDTYELPATFAGAIGVVAVRSHATTLPISYISNASWPQLEFRVQRGSPAGFGAAPASGIFLRLLSSWGSFDGGSLYVAVAMPFRTDLLDYTADLVADIGLSNSMLDVLTLGIKTRLLADAEHGRSSRGNVDQPQVAADVPPKSALGDAMGVFAMYQRRKSEEMNRLRALYPVQM